MTLGLSRVVFEYSECGRKWKGCIIHSREKFLEFSYRVSLISCGTGGKGC